jgi:putative protein-disulfide isomerase
MCSWCYGFTKTYDKFIDQLGSEIEVKHLLGGLAPDSDEPMSEETQSMVKGAWHKIEETIPDVNFNFDYWELNSPRRSTYPACRAVIAAREQGEQYDVIMTKAIQTAYYHKALNPSDYSTLLQLAVEIGLDADLFTSDVNSSRTQEILLSEIKQVRQLKVNSFPSIVVKTDQSIHSVPIDYLDAEVMIDSVNEILK